MARKSKDYDEYDELEEAEDEYDDYDDDEYDDDEYDDYYEPQRKNPLKGFVIALLVLMVVMAAIIGLLYARLRSANNQVSQLNASLEASRTEINNLLSERANATPVPESTPVPTPMPTAEPAEETAPEATPEIAPVITPEPTAAPDPAAQPGEAAPETPAEGTGTAATPEPTAAPGETASGSLKDTITDEMLAGVARPNDDCWFQSPKNGVVNVEYMLALHWGPGMNWYENAALMKDAKVEILAEQAGWKLLRYGEGKYGWALGTLVREEG